MTGTDRNALASDLRQSEGLRLRAYQDSVGVWTIGFGTNLQELRCTEDEAETWLQRKMADSESECRAAFAWFDALSGPRQRAYVELTYNMGLTKFRGFVKMHAAVASGDYGIAADELINSRWYQQVGAVRGDRIAALLRNG